MVWFGTYHCYRARLEEQADRVAAIMHAFARAPGDGRITFQGMLTGTDRFSRLRLLNDASRGVLLDQLQAHAYSSILAYHGPQADATALLSFDVDSVAPGRWHNADYTARCRTATEVIVCEGISCDLWHLVDAAYGFTILARDSTALEQELTATPIQPWKGPRDEGLEARLLTVQRTRHLWGEYVRGATWGVYLGPSLVSRLGGLDVIRRDAPVAEIRLLGHGDVYLRLSKEPLLIDSADYAPAAARLEQFLRPVAVSSEALGADSKQSDHTP